MRIYFQYANNITNSLTTAYYTSIAANNGVVIAGADGSATGGQSLLRSVGGGAWSYVGPPRNDGTWVYDVAGLLVADPSNSSRFYCAIARQNIADPTQNNTNPYVTSDAGVTWSAIGGMGGYNITGISVAADGTVYAAGYSLASAPTSHNYLFKNWVAYDLGAVGTGTGTIAVAPSNSNVAYAVCGNTGIAGVSTSLWQTTNGGASWTQFTSASGLPVDATSKTWSSIVVNPTDPNSVYMVASNGSLYTVYGSTNGGASWAATGGYVDQLAGAQACLLFYSSTGKTAVLASSTSGSSVYHPDTDTWDVGEGYGYSNGSERSSCYDISAAAPMPLYYANYVVRGNNPWVGSYTRKLLTATTQILYRISGAITIDGNGPYAAGAQITIGPYNDHYTSDGSGNYDTGEWYGATENLSITVGNLAAGYSVDQAIPISFNMSSADQVYNFTLTPPTYSLSGNVSGAVGTGVTINLAGSATGSTITDGAGDYSFGSLLDGNYTVTPQLAGYSFTPLNSSQTISGANISGVNFTSAVASHSISGVVSGDVISGVVVDLSGDAVASTTTDGSGNYSFTGLSPSGGSYIVTPSQAGYTFSPVDQAVVISGLDATGVNFTSSLITYSISGTVSGDTIFGVGIHLSGAVTSSTTTDISGHYTFTGLSNGNYTVTPLIAGNTFLPTSTGVTIASANVIDVDFISSLIRYSVSGTITGAITSGVIVHLVGPVILDTTTDAGGAYSFSGLLSGNYSVYPDVFGYSFGPVASFYLSAADVSGINFNTSVTTSAGDNLSLCQYNGTNSQYIALGGGAPSGGTWSGVGVVQPDLFDASISPGNYVVTYTYNGISAYKTITVYPWVLSASYNTYCQQEMGFTTIARSAMPAGKYSIEYNTGIDILMSSVGDALYMGCNGQTLVYSAPPHLGLDSAADPSISGTSIGSLGANVYDSGYVYGSHFPANALLLEARLMDRQMDNSAVDDRLGISPCKTYNKQSPFPNDDRHSLMVMHYENCVDNFANFYALYDKLFLVEGQFNEAAAFTLSPLIVDNLQYVNINEGTIMMWLKRLCTQRGQTYYIIDMEPFKSSDLINPAFSLYIDDRNRLIFEIVGYTQIPGTAYVRQDTFAVRYPITAKDLDNTGLFNHVAITWKNNSTDPEQNFMRLYVNGIKQSILKYDTGAKFGVDGVSEEEQVMGDYIAHSIIDASVPYDRTTNSGPAVWYIGTPSQVPAVLPDDVVTIFARAICGDSIPEVISTPSGPRPNQAYTSCRQQVTADRVIYVAQYDEYGQLVPVWGDNQFGETSLGLKNGSWVVLQNNVNDPTKDQVRQIVANTGNYILVDEPWDVNPLVNGATLFTVCGSAYFISARLDKFMQKRLPRLDLSADIKGLFGYFTRYVLGTCAAGSMTNPCMPATTWSSNNGFRDWVNMLNEKPAYQYDAVPVDYIDIKSTGRELRHLSVVNTANLYDFPRIYVGSNRFSQNLGMVAIDQLAFYSVALTDEDMSIYQGPSFINTTGNNVTLGYDFDATSLPISTFTTLQDKMGRSFETYINVLNPFGLPIDRALLTNLLNMIKPSASTFYINYS